MGAKGDKRANKQPRNDHGLREKRSKRLSPKVFAENSGFITLTMNEFFVSYLFRLYHAFDGDILQAMVLGSIAHHNVSRLSRQQEYDAPRIKKVIAVSGEEATLAPCNAFSISQATGIPRETVRRKIVSLVDKGWIKRDGRGQLFLAHLPAVEFKQFNYEIADDFLDAALRILHRCQKGSSAE
jgi:hypothetical protein